MKAKNYNSCNGDLTNINIDGCKNIPNNINNMSAYIVQKHDRIMFESAPEMLDILKKLSEILVEDTDIEFQFCHKDLIKQIKRLIKKIK